jgi:CRISPR/Cas system-associated exonuclease Cas4 (RecB family)
VLPGPPDYWSYSSLKEIGECPRRYALERAGYPDLWGGRGYPSLPTAPALFGNVVHGALEVVVKAFTEAGIDSSLTLEATDVLRGLGGLTTVIEDVASEQLAPLDDNPRLDPDRRRRIARELRAQTPEARVQVQTYLSRTIFVPGAHASTTSVRVVIGRGSRRRPLGEGSRAEVALIADDLRLLGRIDLLTIDAKAVSIVDYKTGAESQDHRDQLRLYALLWEHDSVANPEHLPTASLTAAYRERDVSVEVPSVGELQALSDALAYEVEQADVELRSGAPSPIPSKSNCARCAVRHLCEVYWKEVVPKLSDTGEEAWFAYEGTIGEQNGPRSWWAIDPQTDQPELLVRTTTTTPPFTKGDRVRMLGLRRDIDPEVNSPLATLTATSEVFLVEVAS